jgi:hypothetical protein
MRSIPDLVLVAIECVYDDQLATSMYSASCSLSTGWPAAARTGTKEEAPDRSEA